MEEEDECNPGFHTVRGGGVVYVPCGWTDRWTIEAPEARVARLAEVKAEPNGRRGQRFQATSKATLAK